MNILFFLKPKAEVSYLYEDFSMRQGLEKLERSGYTAIPVINRQGKYIGTITEGDFLWSLKNKFALASKPLVAPRSSASDNRLLRLYQNGSKSPENQGFPGFCYI